MFVTVLSVFAIWKINSLSLSDITQMRFVGKLIKYGRFLKLIQFYFNNMIILRHLTQRIMSLYTYKMAVVS